MDVDGVLTDGKIVLDHQGRETKSFHVLDGFAIVVFRKLGFKTAVLSARRSSAVTARGRDLKIDRVYQDAYPKLHAYQKLLRDFRLTDHEACFAADDLSDLAVFKKVGLAVAVKNAVREIKDAAHYVTRHPGGGGAVRETIELILKGQGQWKKVLKLMG